MRKASRPPRWSTVLSAFADTRSLTERPSASDIMVTLSRLGRKRRLVLIFEWLTLCPTCMVLPVSSHRRDIGKPLSDPKDLPIGTWHDRRHGSPAKLQAGGPYSGRMKGRQAAYRWHSATGSGADLP